MLTDAFQLVVLVLYLALVPGLPFALHLARKASNWRLVLALAPVFSIGANFLVLFVLNTVGIRPNLAALGVVLVLATGLLLVREGLPRLDELKVIGRETTPILPAAALGAIIWRQAFSGYLLLAPNQDALNHNRWIARIAEVGSTLTTDAMVDSPLQKLGTGSGFYPLAWHADVAIGSELSSLVVPSASLISVALFWIVVLPAGLSALAKMWSPQTRHLGAVAAMLVQLYPLVPGVPLSWGSMTSCVGIALLPAGLITSTYMLRESGRIWVVAGVATAATIFFVHTPEAATLAVLVFVQFLAIGSERLMKNLVRIALGVAVFAVPALWIFRDYIFGDGSGLRSLFGAPEPSWERAIGLFFSMDLNAKLGFSVLAFLFIAGLITAASDARDRWMIYGVLALGMVYVISGSGSGFLSHFRIFTAPWYASYERTLWVLVPFAALISAYAIARLLPANVEGGIVKQAVLGTIAATLLVVVVFEQVKPSINQIRGGPAQSAMIGANDRDLMHEAAGLLHDGEIAIGFGADGTIYPYVYEGIPVTGGTTLGRDGKPSKGVAAIIKNLGKLCSSSRALAAFEQDHVGLVFLAKRGVWGEPLWTDADARDLKGLDVVRSGDLLILLVPDLAECS